LCILNKNFGEDRINPVLRVFGCWTFRIWPPVFKTDRRRWKVTFIKGCCLVLNCETRMHFILDRISARGFNEFWLMLNKSTQTQIDETSRKFGLTINAEKFHISLLCKVNCHVSHGY